MSTSALECLVLIANLCLHSVTSIEMRDTGLGASAVVHGRGFEADIVLRSDNFSTPDWSRMNEACAEGICIAYFKHCAANEGAVVCEYHFSQPGEMQNTVVTIISNSRSELQMAETKIGALMRSGWALKEVPLSTFTSESEGSTPPYCKRKAPQSACWPAVK